MRNHVVVIFLLASTLIPSAAPAQDDDLVTYKALSPDLALLQTQQPTAREVDLGESQADRHRVVELR